MERDDPAAMADQQKHPRHHHQGGDENACMQRGSLKRTRQGEGEGEEEEKEEEEGQASLVGLPYELTMEVVDHAAREQTSSLGVLKTLRLVCRDLNQVATDVLVGTYLRRLESSVEQLRAGLTQAWAAPRMSEARATQLGRVFEEVASAAHQLEFLRAKLEDKKQARATIFKMSGIDADTRWRLLKACSFESELLGLKYDRRSLSSSMCQT